MFVSLAPIRCLECEPIEQAGDSKDLMAGPLPRTIATDGWIRNSQRIERACAGAREGRETGLRRLGNSERTYLACGCSLSLPTRCGKMAGDMSEKACMSTKATERLVREGDFVAEADVHLIEAEGG